MAGQFSVDIDSLRSAVRELRDARQRLDNLTGDAESLLVGELTARDPYTQGVQKNFNLRAIGDNSLQATVIRISKILQQKITAYNESIAEYLKAEEHSTVHRGHIDA